MTANNELSEIGQAYIKDVNEIKNRYRGKSLQPGTKEHTQCIEAMEECYRRFISAWDRKLAPFIGKTLPLGSPEEQEYMRLWNQNQRDHYVLWPARPDTLENILSELRNPLLTPRIAPGVDRCKWATEIRDRLKKLREKSPTLDFLPDPTGDGLRDLEILETWTERAIRATKPAHMDGGAEVADGSNLKLLMQPGSVIEYPLRNRGHAITNTEVQQRGIYILSEADRELLRRYFPNDAENGYHLGKLESFLIQKCGMAPKNTGDLSWTQLLDLVKNAMSPVPPTGPVGNMAGTQALASADSEVDAKTGQGKIQDPRTVFVVHGRNQRIRDAMFTFLGVIGLHPLEWSEAVSATRKATPYVGEVLDTAFSIARAVLVLFTPDDEARLRMPFQQTGDPSHEVDLTGQARPNVIFEAGMAMGRCSDRTVIVEVGTLRPFSDLGGRHVIRLDNSLERRRELACRLRTAGCPVNFTGTDWHHAGDFTIDQDIDGQP